MSLIRQIWLLLAITLLMAFLGSFGVWMASSRGYLETQLRLKNADNAQSLALSLSQQKGDLALMDLAVSAQFDTGYYKQIRLKDPTGQVMFNHEADPKAAVSSAPDWFVRMVQIDSPAGVAQVTDGWRALGSVEVVSHSGFAYDQLWRGSLKTAMWLVVLGAVAGVMASIGVRGIRRPLDATVGQAQALMERRFITVDEPKVPELARLTQAMNMVVSRLKFLFEEQAGQVENLRQQAHCDTLTGLSHRRHFMGQLQSALLSEDGPATGVLYLVRLMDLSGINRSMGHRQTDVLLQKLAELLLEVTHGIPGVSVGRLNGGDFAVCLHEGTVPLPQAEYLADTLRRLFAEQAVVGQAVVGATRWARGVPMTQVLAAADSALARAESRGNFAVEHSEQLSGGHPPVLGEDEWRRRLSTALAEHRAQLVRFPVIDGAGALVHHECPMRLQLEPGGPFEAAAQWLPMALRCGLMTQIDELAVTMALQDIAADGIPRGVNLSPASLADSGFVPRLRAQLASAPAAAHLLWLEVAESAALERFEMVREMCKQLRPMGVRIGLEHAGERLARIDFLFEAGLDYVKLDAAVVQGVAHDNARQAFVTGTVNMLRSLGLAVFAEGVNDLEDLAALWPCGIHGATGPAVRMS
jgi:EAL domain-containing protein (putative c-di-GMP-specific phosphodiesterase class I)/GGDEF domain-containing protein